MESLLLVFGGGGVALAGRYVWDRRAGHEALAGRQLDAEAKQDYQAAPDAYEAARRAVGRIAGSAGVSSVVDVLADGRYALACVRARAAGERVPEYRVPCFFNAQHGPSVARGHAKGLGGEGAGRCGIDDGKDRTPAE